MTRSGKAPGSSRAVLIAVAFFALGLLAARLLGVLSPGTPPSGQPSTAATSAAAPQVDSDAGAPRILFDPSSISLLPDASLTIELPSMPDASASPP